MFSMKKVLTIIAILFLVLSPVTPAIAATTISWDGDTSAAWATGTNWGGDTAPADDLTTDIASFDLVGPYSDSGTPWNPVITGSRSVNGLSIAASNSDMSLTGGTLTVGAGNIIVASANGTGIGTSLAGNASLTQSGAGSLTLSGANTYAGGTTLTAGTLNINHATALGSGTIHIDAGTIDNTSGAAKTLTSTGSQIWDGNFTFTGTNDLDLGAGAVNVGAALRVISISNASTLTVGGVMSGTGGVKREGGDANGELLLSGNNIHTGITMVASGILTLSGNNSGASGGVTINGGILNINSATALGAGAFTINGGTIDNTSAGDITVTTANSQNWAGSFTYTGSAHSLNLGTGGVSVLSANRTITVGGNTLAIDGDINGGWGITKAGAGRLALSGKNTYTGATTVDAGTLALQFNTTNKAGVINSSSALTLGGASTLSLLGGTVSEQNFQTFTTTTLSGGQSTVSFTLNNASNITLTLGTLTNITKSYLNFTRPGGVDIRVSHALDASGALLGTWASVGSGASLAYAADSNATNGAITAYSGATDATESDLSNMAFPDKNFKYAGAPTVVGLNSTSKCNS